MTRLESIVIAGAGQAGFQTAASLRQDGYEGRIILFGDEPGLPYQRPPLSKTYLKEGDADRLAFRPAAFFEDNRIDYEPGRRLSAIDRAARSVEIEGGSRLVYDHLVLGLGARNRPLPVAGATLDGVHEMRTLAHATALRESLKPGMKLVVIGGGFIGLEAAAAVRSLGCEAVVIEAAPRLMARAASEPLSAYLLERHREMGVDIRLGVGVSKLVEGAPGRIGGVELGDGETIACDLALVGIGVLPNVEIAEAAGLETANGIVVDETLLTSDPAISAIGDVACFPHRRMGERVRLESVQNAVDQAKCVSQRLTGKPGGYDAVAWFWSDQGPYKIQMAGLVSGADERITREGPNGKGLSVFSFAKGVFVGSETVDAPKDHMFTRRLLASGKALSPADFEDADFDLKALL